MEETYAPAITIDRTSSTPLYVQIAGPIEAAILSGELPAGAMIEDEDTAIARVLQMAKQGTVQAEDGSIVALQADSVCVHGDGPKALAFVQKISAALPASGVEVKAF